MTVPRISIVTPCLNAADYIDAALHSVLNQGYPSLEYVVIDGGSTDGTVDILRRHEAQLTSWVSEPDRGHGHALNKGFAGSTGEIMGWLNADDILHPGSLDLLAHLFGAFPDVDWLTGQPSHVDARGRPVAAYPPRRWSRLGFLTGDHRWIQQESTFWRRSLWERAGGHLSEDYSLACDLELWMRFFRHARLQSTWGLLGAFRFRPDQRTRAQMEEYEAQTQQILRHELREVLDAGGLGPQAEPWAGSPPLITYDWQALRYVRAAEAGKSRE